MLRAMKQPEASRWPTLRLPFNVPEGQIHHKLPLVAKPERIMFLDESMADLIEHNPLALCLVSLRTRKDPSLYSSYEAEENAYVHKKHESIVAKKDPLEDEERWWLNV